MPTLRKPKAKAHTPKNTALAHNAWPCPAPAGGFARGDRLKTAPNPSSTKASHTPPAALLLTVQATLATAPKASHHKVQMRDIFKKQNPLSAHHT
jgi:hypothetical protein